jgi:hypothetical protein
MMGSKAKAKMAVGWRKRDGALNIPFLLLPPFFSYIRQKVLEKPL